MVAARAVDLVDAATAIAVGTVGRRGRSEIGSLWRSVKAWDFLLPCLAQHLVQQRQVVDAVEIDRVEEAELLAC